MGNGEWRGTDVLIEKLCDTAFQKLSLIKIRLVEKKNKTKLRSMLNYQLLITNENKDS